MKSEQLWLGVAKICAQHELSDDAWIEALLNALRPVLDRDGLGIAGGSYFCEDPCSLETRLLRVLDFDHRLHEILIQGLSGLSPTYVSHTFLNGSFGPGSDFAGWDDIPPVRDGALRSAGADETSAVRCAELDGSGIWFVSFRRRRIRPAPAEWNLLARVQRHITLTYRMRRRLKLGEPVAELAAAVLDSSGRVVHATGQARDVEARAQLAAAVQMDRHPSSRRRPIEGLIDGRFSLLPGAEVGESGYTLAIDNRPCAPALELLSARERQVVAHALRGQTNKEIAYELGLADPTVRVLMRRAARKLGVRSRNELLTQFLQWSGPEGR